MSKTAQGAFDMTYHHIDAPTVQDDEWGRVHKQRKLVIPYDHKNTTENFYRSDLLQYLSDLPWLWTRKIDGENIRIQWDGEKAVWNGKSNNFQCGADFTKYMNETFLEEIFEEKFGREKTVTLFGEHMGPKVQGNELGLGGDEFILYDVNVNGTWLSTSDVRQVAEYFGLCTVYELGTGIDTLSNLIKRVSDGSFRSWEGIVARPLVEMRDQNNHRVIVKIKNKDYLREES